MANIDVLDRVFAWAEAGKPPLIPEDPRPIGVAALSNTENGITAPPTQLPQEQGEQ